MGWCEGGIETMAPPFRMIPEDTRYWNKYEHLINTVLNAVRYLNYISKYYFITDDGHAIPKIWR